MSIHESRDAGKCSYKDLCPLVALKIARTEYKSRDLCRRESGAFDIAISYTLIFGENNAAVLPDDIEPFFVSGIGRKVIIVEMDRCSRLA